MINHGRTLLLNRDGSKRHGYGTLGEEFVPATYQRRDIPQYLQTILNTIFGGPEPDHEMMNYRLREIVNLLHTTEVEQFLSDLDDRFTYWPVVNPDLYMYMEGTTVVQTAGTGAELYVIGQVQKTNGQRLTDTWRVEILSSSQVSVAKQSPPATEDAFFYVITEGVSDVHPLPGSELSFRFQQAMTGTVWFVEKLTRPVYDLALLTEILSQTVNQDISRKLFGFGTVSEPYKTFRNLWFNNEQLAFKLGGLLMAVIYRINEVAPPAETT